MLFNRSRSTSPLSVRWARGGVASVASTGQPAYVGQFTLPARQAGSGERDCAALAPARQIVGVFGALDWTGLDWKNWLASEQANKVREKATAQIARRARPLVLGQRPASEPASRRAILKRSQSDGHTETVGQTLVANTAHDGQYEKFISSDITFQWC